MHYSWIVEPQVSKKWRKLKCVIDNSAIFFLINTAPFAVPISYARLSRFIKLQHQVVPNLSSFVFSTVYCTQLCARSFKRRLILVRFEYRKYWGIIVIRMCLLPSVLFPNLLVLFSLSVLSNMHMEDSEVIQAKKTLSVKGGVRF